MENICSAVHKKLLIFLIHDYDDVDLRNLIKVRLHIESTLSEAAVDPSVSSR